MLINPFEVEISSDAADIKEDMQGVIDEITETLISSYPALIAKVEAGEASRGALEAEILRVIDNLDDAKKYPRDLLTSAAFDSIFGYGILEKYIKDPDVSDIMVNSPEVTYIKKFGKSIRVPVYFGDERRLLNYCRKVVAICGGKINENEAEVVVTDRKRNLRIVISIYPVNVGSPSISIRKQTTNFSISELTERGMLDEEIADHLTKSVKARETIVIAGKGGSGKTTLLGALLNEVPLNERGLLIQETNEIRVTHPNIVSQIIKVSDAPDAKNYTLFDLTKFGLLMSLDRMFIGELKDREAFDFFNAVFTGHNGSMATVHSNSAEETIDRLVLLMKRADTDLTSEYLMELLTNSLNQVVFMKDYRVFEISEVVGFDRDKKRAVYNTLFTSDVPEGEFLRAGVPSERLKRKLVGTW